MKIRKKITLTFMSILFISLLIVSIVSYIIVKNIVTLNALHNLESISIAQLNYLENIDEQNLERLKLVTSRTQLRISLQAYNKNPEKQYQTKMNKILYDCKSPISDFKEISVINLDGVIIASTNEENIGTEHLDKDCFLRGQKENITNHFFLDKDMNLDIHLSGPLILDNELLGVLLITSSGDKITKFVTDYSLFGETGYTFLVVKTDEQNKFLTSQRRVRGKPTKYAYTNYDDFGQISRKVIEKQKGTYKILYDYLNEPMSAVVNYSDKLEIGYSVRLSREEILTPVIRYRNLLAIISIFSLLITFIYTFWGAKSITKPVLKLTTLAKKISGGDLDQKIEIKSKDEIGILSKAFNTMTGKLKQDINKRKKAEQALQKAYDEMEIKVEQRTEQLSQANIKLQELDKLKSMFIASMSHELRTPLNSIIGFTGLLLQGISGKIDDEARKDLDIVYNSSKHLLGLINDVIDISKIEADKFDIHFEDVKLDGVIEEVVASISKDAEKKKLKIKTELPEGLIIVSDRRRIFQCILNLMGNAVKFTEKGAIELKAVKKADVLKVTVTDTGIGIKKEDLSKLFKSFTRLDSPLKAVTSGTGLGLHLTKKIMTNVFQGEISVISEYGKGSTFTLDIPLKQRIEHGERR
ncbi:MAG: HAMP domain-containing protein [Candidatus Cloacimonetes bacterium]|nr:HAMP domain-containing protein [Candidatus Cloacimonadota bacterium]